MTFTEGDIVRSREGADLTGDAAYMNRGEDYRVSRSGPNRTLVRHTDERVARWDKSLWVDTDELELVQSNGVRVALEKLYATVRTIEPAVTDSMLDEWIILQLGRVEADLLSAQGEDRV